MQRKFKGWIELYHLLLNKTMFHICKKYMILLKSYRNDGRELKSIWDDDALLITHFLLFLFLLQEQAEAAQKEFFIIFLSLLCNEDVISSSSYRSTLQTTFNILNASDKIGFQIFVYFYYKILNLIEKFLIFLWKTK